MIYTIGMSPKIINNSLITKNLKGFYTTDVFHIQLQKIRNFRGYRKQTDVLEGLDIQRQTYSLWEQGKRFPNMEKLQQIGNFFKIDLNYFFLTNAEPSDYDLTSKG